MSTRADNKRETRAWPVVLFVIPGWPSQEPNRKLVWKVYYAGEDVAMRAVKRLNKKLAGDAVFELAMMTRKQAERLRKKPFSITEQRVRQMAEAADAS